MIVTEAVNCNLVLGLIDSWISNPVFLEVAMASMPFSMHAVKKVRENMSLVHASSDSNKKWNQGSNNSKYNNNSADQYADPMQPSKYPNFPDKMMNSIWGLYNRYSVHNFKSMTAGASQYPALQQQSAFKENPDWLQKPAIKSSLEGMQMNLKMKNFHQ